MADAYIPGTSAHDLVKAEKYANVSIGLLQREMALSGLFWRWSAQEFKGAKDDTINIKVPGSLPARDRDLRAVGDARKIQMDFLKERKIGVRLNKFPYSATEVTDEQFDLDITDFSQQILAPQVYAIAQYIERMAVGTLTSATYADGRLSDDMLTVEDKNTIKGTLKAEDFYGPGKFGMASLFNRIRSQAIKRGLNVANLTVAIGADVEEVLLEELTLLNAGFAGDNTALRDATIGRLRGFTFVTVPYLNPSEAYVFDSTAFVLATAAPSVPAGAVFGASQSANGTALRWLRDYDADYAVDRSIVDCYAGTGVVNDIAFGDDSQHFLRAFKITMDRAKVDAAKAAGAATAATTPASSTPAASA